MKRASGICLGGLVALLTLASVLPGQSKTPKSSQNGFDACVLLTAKEVEEVQHAPVKEARRSESFNGSLLTSQCFYAAAEFARSVNLTVARAGQLKVSRSAARDHWMQIFHGPDKPQRGAVSSEERESEEPRPVRGLGEEAFWLGNRISGAVYVLEGNSYLRISVGGPGDEAAKMERAKRLARQALRRLPSQPPADKKLASKPR